MEECVTAEPLAAGEQELRDSRQRLKTIFDSAPAGIMRVDAETRAILEINPAALRMMGRSREEVLGNRCHKFVCPAELGRCPVLDLGQKVDNAERVLLSADGGRVPILKNVVVVEIGGKRCLIEIFADLTARKQAEEALRGKAVELEKKSEELVRARDVAMQSTRLKTEFLANMSHEIRTPMHGLMGMTELLLSTRLDAEQRQYATAIRGSAESMLTVVNEILDLSKIEAGKLSLESVAFDLRDLLREVDANMALRAAAKNVALSFTVKHGVPGALVGDPGRLRQVLLNLLGNAIKFTSQGSVELRVEPLKECARSFMLRFVVEDTGIGIGPEQQRELFQPFVQADGSTTRKYGGTGLGLAISKQLTELMGGEIGLTSEPGRGSRFWFTSCFGRPAGNQTPAPHPEAKSAAAAAKPGAPSGPPSQPPPLESPLRVLLAEDNDVNQKIGRTMLERLGCRCTVVATGKDAVEAAMAEAFDLILMDVQMPEMDGFEATARIRRSESGRRVPIVAMTANAMSGARDQCLAAGMDDYISKPFGQGQLRQLLCAISPPPPKP